MKALQSLSELFAHHVTEPQHLNVWAEDGELICTQGLIVDGFDIAYTVLVDIYSAEIQPHILMMHLIAWLNKYDVGREEKGLAPPSFATELLDKGKCDIKLRIDIQESYSLIENEKGSWLQNGIRYECVSQFEEAVVEEDLLSLQFINGPKDLPASCS